MYYIDGYNLLFSICKDDIDLQKNRKKLISFFYKKFKELKISADIIFDGKGDIEYHYLNPITIIFTPEGQSADDYILEKLSCNKTPSQITIVTTDRQLTKLCREKGAKIQTINQFFNWMNKKRNREESTSLLFEESKANIDHLSRIFEKRLKT